VSLTEQLKRHEASVQKTATQSKDIIIARLTAVLKESNERNAQLEAHVTQLTQRIGDSK
jgi:hypothetical protein